MKKPNGFVYVVKGGGYYKIGYSKEPDRRIATLSTQPPFELEVIYLCGSHNARALEADLHGLFKHARVRGEWFDLDDMDREMLSDVMKTLGTFNHCRNRLALYGIRS